jgi:hypothetical protein
MKRRKTKLWTRGIITTKKRKEDKEATMIMQEATTMDHHWSEYYTRA